MDEAAKIPSHSDTSPSNFWRKINILGKFWIFSTEWANTLLTFFDKNERISETALLQKKISVFGRKNEPYNYYQLRTFDYEKPSE